MYMSTTNRRIAIAATTKLREFSHYFVARAAHDPPPQAISSTCARSDRKAAVKSDQKCRSWVSGHRHGHRSRTLLGTFGQSEDRGAARPAGYAGRQDNGV